MSMDLPGDRDIIQAGLDEAAQSLFTASDVPLASAEELRALVTGPAVRAVLEARIEQVVKHGHTPAKDAELPIKHLPAHARSMIVDTLDLLEGPRRNLVVGKKRLAKAAAMLLAAIGRVDFELQSVRGTDEHRNELAKGEGN
jgi:hypothetical protein